MKKIWCMVMALSVAVCFLAGCSKEEDVSSVSSSQVSSQGSEADGPYKIGLIQYMEHPSLDTVREAFMSRLEEWGYNEEKVLIDYQNAGGDSAKAESICEKFKKDGVDMMVAISSPAAQKAVSAAQNTDIKVLFAAVDDPEKELGLKDLERPEGNVTGTRSKSSVTAVIDLALQADPGLKTLGLLYNPEEAISKAQVEEAKAYCGEKGLAVEETTVAGNAQTEDISKSAASLAGKAGAVFTPMDSTVSNVAGTLAKAFREAKKPWYAGEDALVQNGALAAVSVDYTEIGNKNADMAVVLIEGKAVSEVPVYSFETYETYINQTTLETVGTQFPQENLESAHLFADSAAA